MAKQTMPTALLKAATLTAAIDAAIKSRGQMQAEEHELLFQSVLHAKEHGDTTFIAKMINEMPNGVRVEAMADWLKEFFPIEGRAEKNAEGVKQLNIHGRVKVVFKLSKDRKDTDWQMEKAWATPFFNFKKENPAAVFDVDSLAALLDKYIKRGEKAIAEGNFKGSKEDFLKHKETVFDLKRRLNVKTVVDTRAAQAA